MSARGRHARRSSMSFYRDALLLVGGIVIVGALVFGGLSLWAGSADGETSAAATSVPEGDGATMADATSTTTTDASVATTEPTAPFTTGATTTPATDSPDTTMREAREPADVRVVVLNSIGVTGLAGELSGELAGLGYQMAQADNYSPELSDTMIFHAEGFSIEAVELIDAIPDASVAIEAELTSAWGVDIVVVIGRSYQE